MSGIKNVLIAGASGNLGPAILNEFVSSGKFSIFVISRPESKATFPDGVKVLKAEYTPSSLKALFDGQQIDAVISNLGGPAIGDAQTALIDASKAAGVKRFFPSEFGSDTTNPKVLEVVPIFGGKIKAVEHLKQVQSETFTWTTLITGPFFDWGLKVGFIPVNVKEKKFTRWDDGNIPFSTTTLPTIGKALVSILSSPANLSATANKPVFIASYTTTLNEVFATAQKVTGDSSSSWTVEELDSDVAIKKAREDFAKGDFAGAFVLLKAGILAKAGLGDYRAKGLSNELLGLPKEDLETDVKRIVGQLVGK